MQPIYPGQRILVEIKFYLNGVPTDPVVARCLIIDPTGSETILTYPATTFTKRDSGFFEASVTLDRAGSWQFRAEAAGTVDAVDETAIVVSNTSFT
jgi:hypothetical protein